MYSSKNNNDVTPKLQPEELAELVQSCIKKII